MFEKSKQIKELKAKVKKLEARLDKTTHDLNFLVLNYKDEEKTKKLRYKILYKIALARSIYFGDHSLLNKIANQTEISDYISSLNKEKEIEPKK